MKIRPVGAELLRADRRADMTKLIVAFRNFGDAPKILHLLVNYYILVNFSLQWLRTGLSGWARLSYQSPTFGSSHAI